MGHNASRLLPAPPLPSFRRRACPVLDTGPESSSGLRRVGRTWTPAFAGVTEKRRGDGKRALSRALRRGGTVQWSSFRAQRGIQGAEKRHSVGRCLTTRGRKCQLHRVPRDRTPGPSRPAPRRPVHPGRARQSRRHQRPGTRPGRRAAPLPRSQPLARRAALPTGHGRVNPSRPARPGGPGPDRNTDPNREPVNHAAMADLLAAEQPIENIYFGPAFRFPDSEAGASLRFPPSVIPAKSLPRTRYGAGIQSAAPRGHRNLPLHQPPAQGANSPGWPTS